MRILPLLAVAVLLLPAATAQTMTVTSAHQVRIGYGDLPVTDDQVEPAGHWNVEQLLVLEEGANGTILVPTGHTLGTIHCADGCDFDATVTGANDGASITVVCNTPTDAGVCSVAIPHRSAGTVDAFALRIPVLADHTVFVYALEGLDVRSGTEDLLEQPFYYPGLQPATLIHQFRADTGTFWVTISPQSTVAAPGNGSTILLAGLAGLLVGAVAWYLLVAQGVVQKRQRRQVAGETAHSQAAKKENRATLEARKRALMAALKDLEMARMDQTIDLDAYDVLKADFKRQAVTVMRALDEAPSE